TDTLNVPMWQAEMFLAPESTIGITHKSGSEGTKTYVYTDLTGGIDIVGDFLSSDGGGVPGVEFKGIRFEHIVYNSDGSQFDIADFSFASEQKSTAGFPLNINDIGIDISMPRVGITFDLALVLSDAGFSAEAGLGIYGAFDFSGDRETFRFDGVDLTHIEISQQCNGITLEGRLDFYNNDATYGDGLKGHIHVVLPMGIEGSLTVQFGTKKNPGVENPVFNTRDFYPYWYVDGLIRIPAGVTIFSGFAIYGFGGGVYYRMRPDYSALTSTASMFGEEGVEPASGVRYIPDWETLGGFKIMAILGTQPSENAFNMDVTIEMSFTTAGGVGSFSIDGAGYVMVSFQDRPEAKIYATIHFAYINPGDGSERVEGDFAIYVDFGEF
ncbi:MAG: hypothetical protein KAQ79_08960, partial [Cyclobacteriaceae bacterium]|nr:hypothetical protein [Cyclobacteriaceae bacterium]